MTIYGEIWEDFGFFFSILLRKRGERIKKVQEAGMMWKPKEGREKGGGKGKKAAGGIININKKHVSYKICCVFHQLCSSSVWCIQALGSESPL